MPKTIPLALLTHKAGNTLTTSYLRKIGPLKDGSYVCSTSLDRDEVYDDGGGERTYYAQIGNQLSALQASTDGGIDNAESQSLIAVYPAPGISEDTIRQGLLETARYIIYEHDYLNGAAGVQEIVGGGVIGRIRIEQGLVCIPELRSWMQLLNQTGLIDETSLLCPARKFGSQSGEERNFCGYDLVANGEWIDFTVTSVGAETEREFTASALLQATDYFAFGMVEWTGGDNTGSSIELESFTSGGAVALRFLCRVPVQVGDTGKIRRGCSRQFTGHNSCETYFGTDRGLHHRGQPYTPIGDAIANNVPGVNTTQSTGGTGE